MTPATYKVLVRGTKKLNAMVAESGHCGVSLNRVVKAKSQALQP